MIILDLEQGSTEWKQARAGKVTASRLNDLMATIKGGEAAARRDYRTQILVETLTGQPADDTFVNDAMRHGTEQEPYARAEYEILTGHCVNQVGMVMHPFITRAGASPDGLIGTDGLVEIKCPKTATHLEHIMSGAVPTKYKKQMAFQMACTGASWCDFTSYDPRVPEHLQLFVVRYYRDDKLIGEIEEAIVKFLAEVDADIAKLQARVA